ncbi:MAG: VOC family protein [Acidobacteriota bacterium]|nr:VOC family protein [Acidobacteriota bacterium]
MTKETIGTVQALKAHVALNVKNAEASIEFYRKVFGIEPSKVRTGYAKFDVQNPPLNLTLNERQFKERGALSHMGIQVASTSDVLAMREKWADAGLITRDEMQTDCCYATQDKTWVRDPDGNEWEAFVVLKDNLPETAPCECGDKVSEAEAGSAVNTEALPEASGEVAAPLSCCGTSAPANPVSIAR